MLEYPKLLVETWAPPEYVLTATKLAPEFIAFRRAILDLETGRKLGFVRRIAGWAPPWLTPFLPFRRTLQVHESEDESLLFTMHGRGRFREGTAVGDGREGRLSRWEVRDAEKNRIGTIHCALWHDDRGMRPITYVRDLIGRLALFEDTKAFAFASHPVLVREPRSLDSGKALATVQSGTGGIQLAFEDGVAEEPLAKMLLLAGLLALSN